MKQEVKDYLKTDIPESSIIIEIGAHYGEDSSGYLRSLNPRHLYCFEPDPRNIFMFRKHVHDPIISLVECAVSSKNETEVDFYLSYKNNFSPKMFDKYHWIDRNEYIQMKLNASGSSSLKKGGPHSILSIVKVKTVRLDTWAKENNIDRVDFAWIDVQGAEKEVVESFGVLRVDRVWIEYGEIQYQGFMTRKRTIDLFSSIGFELDTKHSDVKLKGDLLFQRKK